MLRPNDRDRLLKVLRLLSSDQVGERASAGAAATRLLREAGVEWDAVIALPAQQARAEGFSHGSYYSGGADFRASLAWLDRRCDLLTPWEVYFLVSIRNRRTLTGKQMAKLQQIVADVATREATP